MGCLDIRMPAGMTAVAIGAPRRNGSSYLCVRTVVASPTTYCCTAGSFVFGVLVSYGAGIMALFTGHSFIDYKTGSVCS